MNKVVKKLDNGDFKVVDSSYSIPISYTTERMQSRLERGRHSTNSTGFCFKFGIYRNNGD